MQLLTTKILLRPAVIAVIAVLTVAVSALASRQSRLPYVIQLPDNENAVIVEKQTQTFFVYSYTEDGWTKQLQVPCSTGEVAGIKLRAGDKKTPEGIYFAKDEYEDKYLTPVYGKKAFPIDYPNLLDKRSRRNGSAIWIHGTNKVLKPMDSNGCIALENQHVVKLSDYIHLNSTPIILVEKIESIQNDFATDQFKEELLSLLKKWTHVLQNGTYQDYLAFYSPLYLPEIGFWRDWLKIKSQLSDQQKTIEFANENIGIYYHNDVFVVLFNQLVLLNEKRIFAGKRKLFLSIHQDRLVIVGDVYQFVPKSIGNDTSPLISSVETVLEPQLAQEKVVKTVKAWLADWSSKDMTRYAAHYADKFYSDGMTKRQWIRRKTRISNKVSYINVTGSSFNVKLKKDRCDVSFLQTYESSAFKANGIKQLKFIKIGGSWKIFQENWKKK